MRALYNDKTVNYNCQYKCTQHWSTEYIKKTLRGLKGDKGAIQ